MPTWYLILWVLVLVLAIFTRSLVAQLCMMFVWALGIYYAQNLGVSSVIQIGLSAVFVLGMGYQAMEMAVKVDKF